MPVAPAQRNLAMLLVVLAATAWSTAPYFVRVLPYDSWTILFWRGVFAAIAVIIFMLATDGRKALGQFARLGRPGWLFALVSGAGMVCYITSLTLTTVAHVAIIYGIVPFVAAGLMTGNIFWLALGGIVLGTTLPMAWTSAAAGLFRKR